MLRMKKLVVLLFTVVVVCATFLGSYVGTANSRPQYLKAFNTKYLKPEGSADEKAFAAEVKEAKCAVCHEGTSKKNRNAYGKELAKLLIPPNEKDPAKIDEALDKAAEMHVDANDPKSPTFADLIKQGKLPNSDAK
jgi:ABC-type Na+ efflux pump permease subunit